MKAILQAAEGTVSEPSLRPRPAVGFNAVGIHFGAARQSIEKGDYLGWEVQAKMLKEKGLAVSREIQCTIHKATGEKPTSCGCRLTQSTFDQSWARAGQGEAYSQFL